MCVLFHHLFAGQKKKKKKMPGLHQISNNGGGDVDVGKMEAARTRQTKRTHSRERERAAGDLTTTKMMWKATKPWGHTSATVGAAVLNWRRADF